MKVGDLKEALDDFGDHLEVSVEDNEGNEYEIEELLPAADREGDPCCVISVTDEPTA